MTNMDNHIEQEMNSAVRESLAPTDAGIMQLGSPHLAGAQVEYAHIDPKTGDTIHVVGRLSVHEDADHIPTYAVLDAAGQTQSSLTPPELAHLLRGGDDYRELRFVVTAEQAAAYRAEAEQVGWVNQDIATINKQDIPTDQLLRIHKPDGESAVYTTLRGTTQTLPTGKVVPAEFLVTQTVKRAGVSHERRAQRAIAVLDDTGKETVVPVAIISKTIETGGQLQFGYTNETLWAQAEKDILGAYRQREEAAKKAEALAQAAETAAEKPQAAVVGVAAQEAAPRPEPFGYLAETTGVSAARYEDLREMIREGAVVDIFGANDDRVQRIGVAVEGGMVARLGFRYAEYDEAGNEVRGIALSDIQATDLADRRARIPVFHYRVVTTVAELQEQRVAQALAELEAQRQEQQFDAAQIGSVIARVMHRPDALRKAMETIAQRGETPVATLEGTHLGGVTPASSEVEGIVAEEIEAIAEPAQPVQAPKISLNLAAQLFARYRAERPVEPTPLEIEHNLYGDKDK